MIDAMTEMIAHREAMISKMTLILPDFMILLTVYSLVQMHNKEIPSHRFDPID